MQKTRRQERNPLTCCCLERCQKFGCFWLQNTPTSPFSENTKNCAVGLPLLYPLLWIDFLLCFSHTFGWTGVGWTGQKMSAANSADKHRDMMMMMIEWSQVGVSVSLKELLEESREWTQPEPFHQEGLVSWGGGHWCQPVFQRVIYTSKEHGNRRGPYIISHSARVVYPL